MIDAADVAKKLSDSRHGDRELDADMHELRGFRVVRVPTNGSNFAWKYRQSNTWYGMSRPTQSLDDALRWIPHGLTFTLMGPVADRPGRFPRFFDASLSRIDEAGNVIGISAARGQSAPTALCLALINGNLLSGAGFASRP